MRQLFILLLFLSFPFTLSAQIIVDQDTTDRKAVLIQFSELMEIIQDDERSVRKLSGNVALQQDSILMYCDTAFMEGSQVTAYGNVVIKQGDSLTVFSDSLVYRSEEKVADLFGEVVLEDGDKKLFTTYLNYDLNSKTGRYTQGGLIIQENTQLISEKGVYYVNSKKLFFKDSVVLVNDNISLRADTLAFDSKSQIATFLGPTLIEQDSAQIYCEDGFYNMKGNVAEFRKNAQYQKGKQRATADLITYDGSSKDIRLTGNAKFIEEDKIATADVIRYEEKNDLTILEGNAYFKDNQQEIKSEIINYDAKKEAFSTSGRSKVDDGAQLLEADQLDYDKDNGLGFARGNVFWQDTIENISIQSDNIDYNKTTNYVKAVGGRPLLATLIGEDTLFLASDTLIATQTEDSIAARILEAVSDVRIYKNGLQATCDSLVYNAKDSLFKLYKNPVIWSDTAQFNADSVYLQLANNEIDRIYLYQNALIINTPDFQFFNQIKGKVITAYFKHGELRKMKVDGNAESIYFARDKQNFYLGMNQTTCSEMLVLFGANEVDNIKFFSQASATMQPMKEVKTNPPTLKGFQWNFDKRPQSVVDLRTIKIVPPQVNTIPPQDTVKNEEEPEINTPPQDTVKKEKLKVKNEEE